MRFRLFNTFNEALVDKIDFDLLDAAKFSDKLIDLKDQDYEFRIVPVLYNYYNNQILYSMEVMVYGPAKRGGPADIIRQMRQDCSGAVVPGFRIYIDIPTEFKAISRLFNLLSVIQGRYSDEFKYDFKQDMDGYQLNFIY